MECYYHVVIDEKQPKRGIQDLKVLGPRKIRKVRESKAERSHKTYGTTEKETREYFVYNEKGLYKGQGQGYSTTFGQALQNKNITNAIVYTHSGLLNSKKYDIVISS